MSDLEHISFGMALDIISDYMDKKTGASATTQSVEVRQATQADFDAF